MCLFCKWAQGLAGLGGNSSYKLGVPVSVARKMNRPGTGIQKVRGRTGRRQILRDQFESTMVMMDDSVSGRLLGI